jgi:tetratricopeptide (TPR) repeat protein
MNFEKMSRSFQTAFGLANSNNYLAAIKLYEEDLAENPNNIASMNNIALAKIHLGINDSNQEYLPEAKELLEKALKIVKENKDYKHGYPIAEANLKWVDNLLEK